MVINAKLTKYGKLFLIGIVTGGFLLLRWQQAAIRFSDTGIYFYTGWQLLQGKVLYKDIFFTNLPLFAYLAAIYVKLTGGNLNAFFAIGAFESAITALLIYRICRKYGLRFLPSLLAISTFLFTTWNHLQAGVDNGIFPAMIFMTTGWLLALGKKPLAAGLLWAMTFSTKAYFFPVLVPLVIWETRKDGWKTILGGLIGGFLFNIFPLLTAPNEFFQQLFGYSLNRTTQFNLTVLKAFATMDTLLLSGSIFLFANFRKNPLPAATSLMFLLFLLIYQDTHYLYYGMWIPFLALGVGQTYQYLSKWKPLQPLILGLAVLGSGYATNLYLGNSKFERFYQLSEAVEKIKQEKPEYLYGMDQMTPNLSYLTGVPLFEEIIDTNEYRYISGQLNRAELTQKALKSKTLLVSYGVNYPDRNLLVHYSPIMFDPPQIEASCQLIGAYQIYLQQDVNLLTLIKCY